MLFLLWGVYLTQHGFLKAHLCLICDRTSIFWSFFFFVWVHMCAHMHAHLCLCINVCACCSVVYIYVCVSLCVYVVTSLFVCGSCVWYPCVCLDLWKPMFRFAYNSIHTEAQCWHQVLSSIFQCYIYWDRVSCWTPASPTSQHPLRIPGLCFHSIRITGFL